MHYGHQALIQQTKQVSDTQGIQSAVLLFDPHPKSIVSPPTQHPSQLMPLDDKIQILSNDGIAHIGCLKFNAALAQLSPHAFIEQIVIGAFKATHLIVGEDFYFGSKRQGSITWLANQNYSLKVNALPLVKTAAGEKISSTLLRIYCQKGKWPQYYQATGRHWQCSGSVQTGQKNSPISRLPYT